MGITDLNKKYELNEIVKGDSIFCATGITTSDVLSGIELKIIIIHLKHLLHIRILILKKLLKEQILLKNDFCLR